MKKKKTRKARIDSPEEQARIVAMAFMDIKPPSHVTLKKEEIPFFDCIIAELAKADWTDHMLEIAAALARNMCMHDKEQKLLGKEGTILKRKNGSPMLNPRHPALQSLVSSIMVMRRTLSLHTNTFGLNAQAVVQRKAASKSTEKTAHDIDSRLIARPKLIN